ncbi:MAG: hypothetical protein KBF26_01925 [Opitutaceae bacterium]|nr:hypothetical protein [Opitutaceae bacterium]
MRYATRNHAFVPATTWVLDGALLRLEDDKGPPRSVALAEVAEVRLTFAPTRPEPKRYRCRLTLRSGGVWEFFNRTYRGVYDFADTSAAYGEFVRALHGALAREAPACRFVAGSSLAAYWFNTGVLVMVGAVLLAAMVFFFTTGMLWVVLIKVLLILVYVPTAIGWLRRNKPRCHTAGSIPPDLLPKQG